MASRVKYLPHVSFIIPTLNAAGILSRCLSHIRAQKYPQKKIEIIISDGGSRDNTLAIAKKYGAKIIHNPEILHEPGKARASRVARGTILFFTDADNIIVQTDWIYQMVQPYLDDSSITGFLPQTEAPPDSSGLNQYLGHLFTDPFTWFVYQDASNPRDFKNIYTAQKKTSGYRVYAFPVLDAPLFGLSQGVGTHTRFHRTGMAWSDDMLSGIKLIGEGKRIAYVPGASVYHYHVNGLGEFIKKYRWRIRNNFTQSVKGMGFVHRKQYFSWGRKVRTLLFVPYAFSIVFPFIDSVRLAIRYRSLVMMWHVLACWVLSSIIVSEFIGYVLGITSKRQTAYGT